MAGTRKEARTERSGIYNPFSDSIMSVRLPEGFNRPVIDKYDGASDPEEHLAVFHAHMLFLGDIATDPIKCSKAHEGRTSLVPANSITNFSDLSAEFLERFALSKPFTETSGVLCNFRQGRHEPLRDFMNRFGQVAMQIRDLDLHVAVRALQEGLKPGFFSDSLIHDPPRNLRELRRTAACCITIKENEGEIDLEEEEVKEEEPTWPYKRRNANP